MKKITHLMLVVALLLSAAVSACGGKKEDMPPADPYIEPIQDADFGPVRPYVQAIDEAALESVETPAYLTQVGYRPQKAQYFDLVNDKLELTDAEIDMLTHNGFVVSDRLAWNRFIEAYAWIYWQDLPVLITTDSLLHAVHQSYSDLLKQLEYHVLIPSLKSSLDAAQARVQQARKKNTDQTLDGIYQDVETYLEVAIALLNPHREHPKEAQAYVTLAEEANTVAEIDLFGSKRYIDFTLFEPRGHYAESRDLTRYFRAMSWLAQIDFRFVEFNPETSEPILHPEQIAAALILRDAVDGVRRTWTETNYLLEVLVGPSDNMTLADLDRFVLDSELGGPANALQADPQAIMTLLMENDYGQQRITGQLIQRHIQNDSSAPIPRPVSFMLMGQRFALDAYVMGNLVYDRLIKDGRPIKRPLPDPLDVTYALGNDRSLAHLSGELETYGYGGHLAALRVQVDGLSPEFWQAPLYNQWLAMIRALNTPTVGETYPQAMRTAAWADKVLHTQLASWAQLRHDNILYVEQPVVVSEIVCEYPSGYVEPYPEFYAALYDLAESGHAALEHMHVDHLGKGAGEARQAALTYFSQVKSISNRLQTLAEKELRQEPFTPEEQAFVKSIVVQFHEATGGCGGPVVAESWDGWYADLFYQLDEDPALIADVHTNPNNVEGSALYPPRVLHVATGPVAAILFIVDTDEGPALYVGPAFTYFEVVEEGDPPVRLSDYEWGIRLNDRPYPAAPEWTASFRLPVTGPPTRLPLPREER